MAKEYLAKTKAYISPPYVYALPLRRWLRERGYVVAINRPVDTIKTILSNNRWLGLVPLASIITNRNLKICPGPMIYSRSETKSVIIVSAKYVDLNKCKKIAVTAETRTSIQYLRYVSLVKKLDLKYIHSKETNVFQLLSLAPCALILADEALRARRYRLKIVADIGLLVRETLGISPVYAVTATKANSKCNDDLEITYLRPSPSDIELASYITGLDKDEIIDYYETIQYGYDPSLLSRAIEVLEKAVMEQT